MTKGLGTVHIEEYLPIIDDVRFAHVDEGRLEPEPRVMISFLSVCPELVRKTKNMTMFRPSCLCLDHGNWIHLKSNLGQLLVLMTDRIFQR